MGFRPLSWQLACALVALTPAYLVSASSIAPSNESTAIGNVNGRIELQTSNGANLSQLVPLTRDALMRDGSPLSGNLHYTDLETVQNLTNTDIAYMSCDPDDYNGNLDANALFQQARDGRNLTAIILYSTSSDYCDFGDSSNEQEEFPVFSMAKKEESEGLTNTVRDSSESPAQKFFVDIKSSGRSNTPTGEQNQNPLGPSPSTAVAMIILYSITGIITALFLVIIITGAVRAHRHPDRYGPRDVLGRPRQSRARGLGRAMLDSIPIVKFGEREPPKPTDVELASTSEARNGSSDETNGTAAETTANDRSGTETGAGTGTGTETETQNTTKQTPTTETTTPAAATAPKTSSEQPSGIAPAVAAGAASNPDNYTPEDHLGCSICTDDFEKGQDIRVLPCNHKFHPECVDPWLLNVSGTCPLCRVDLRPTVSNSSNPEGEDPDQLAPPLQPENDTSNRRRSAFRDILSLRSRPNASAEERISALRRLREQRNRSGDVAEGSANASNEDVAGSRRSRRMSARWSGVFGGGRSRRYDQEPVTSPVAETPAAEAASSDAVSTEQNPTSTSSTTPPAAESNPAANTDTERSTRS